ncbi:twin-arginine translocation signal domain-containing protein [Spirosoma sp. HMF3257]|uniref:Twin-arginine translocation signal domain-containing protein n=1 Tax=Spirosoma telluris TaxID=2183553 RepID=A0A327NI96_9BACT|nr:twin-arginine translocation signal domain-containing protein [Spirosoma telluris]RAI74563.1 hypothetical protein HMF3257_10305 [Spirosoma telluris]
MDNNADHDAGSSTSRREFLAQASVGVVALMTGVNTLSSCTSSRSISHIKGGIVGANHQTGHKLRVMADLHTLPLPSD